MANPLLKLLAMGINMSVGDGYSLSFQTFFPGHHLQDLLPGIQIKQVGILFKVFCLASWLCRIYVQIQTHTEECALKH
jgi:hypothetical protein